MTKKLAACALLLLSGGCRMCSDCCDYAPVVPGGPPLGTTRSGSVLNGAGYGAGYGGAYLTEPVPMPVVAGAAQGATDVPTMVGD